MLLRSSSYARMPAYLEIRMQPPPTTQGRVSLYHLRKQKGWRCRAWPRIRCLFARHLESDRTRHTDTDTDTQIQIQTQPTSYQPTLNCQHQRRLLQFGQDGNPRRGGAHYQGTKPSLRVNLRAKPNQGNTYLSTRPGVTKSGYPYMEQSYDLPASVCRVG